MNYLQCVQRLAQEVGIDPPVTTVGAQANREHRRICDWINSAWLKIQGQHDRRWTWLWENPLLTLPAGQYVLAGSVAASRYDTWQTFDETDGAANNRRLDWLAWDDYSLVYERVGTQGQVTAWTVRPDNALVFNGIPTTSRLIRVQRWKNPAPLVADTDIPGLPEDLHMLIVWKALVTYAGFDEAGGQRAVAKEEVGDLEAALLERCLSPMTLGEALA